MNEKNEIFKPVKGFESFYEISNKGRLRSKDRIKKGFNGPELLKGRILKGSFARGYRAANLSKEGTKKKISFHALVMEAFEGPRPEGYHINHKNGIKDDNRFENLEYCTPAENNAHAIKTGLRCYKSYKRRRTKFGI